MSKHIKRYLSRYREACDELDSLTEEHERIISNIMSITPSYGGESGQGRRRRCRACRSLPQDRRRDQVLHSSEGRRQINRARGDARERHMRPEPPLPIHHGMEPYRRGEQHGLQRETGEGHPQKGAREGGDDHGKARHRAKSAANRRFPCDMM